MKPSERVKTTGAISSTAQQDEPESSVPPFYESKDGRFVLYRGDAMELLPRLGVASRVDIVFADPPYFLSNDGITCHAGQMVSVNKGEWDRLSSVDEMHAFNARWIGVCLEALQKNGSLWVSGTRHVIHSVGFAMQQLGMKVLNDITWEKPNPPPNLSCRYFTHSTETILWAAKNNKSKHKFNYKVMRTINGEKQMKSVWRIAPPSSEEKVFGKHPTQKPLELLERIVLASSDEGDMVVDPFAGSGTTGLAAARLGRRFIGIDVDASFLALSVKRYELMRSALGQR